MLKNQNCFYQNFGLELNSWEFVIFYTSLKLIKIIAWKSKKNIPTIRRFFNFLNSIFLNLFSKLSPIWYPEHSLKVFFRAVILCWMTDPLPPGVGPVCTMVLISDGNSERGEHVRSNFCFLICLRHLIRPKSVANLIFSLR